jgi:thioredoxin 2
MSKETYIIQCTNCTAKNRVPKTRINDHPVCGKCKAHLPEMNVYNAPVMVTDSTFQEEVLSSPGPTVVDCWAPWCGPCKMMGPVLDQLASEYSGKVKVVKINMDQNPVTSSRYHILSIPTLLFFSNGKLVNSVPGAIQKPEILRHLKAIM